MKVERVFFDKGDVIYSAGDDLVGAFIIEDGQVEVFKTSGGRSVPIARLSKGDLFGEMALIDGTRHTRGIRAITDLDCVMISKAEFDRVLAETSPFIRVILKKLVRKLRRTTDLAFGSRN